MAMTMVGTQAPQKLFANVPAEVSQIPGMVTPNITAAMPANVDWAAVLGLQRDSADDWARAAAINNARFAQNRRASGWNTGGSTSASTPSANQTSGMGAQYAPGQGAVLWAPRNITGAQLGTWSDQQQKRAMAENRPPPVVLQAHTGDPYSPGEVGGGVSANVLGRGIYGPGLTSAMGGANPAMLARMWGRRAGRGGETGQGELAEPFPTQSLRERVSPGPKFQYDMFGGR